jgi:hypothetical protein
MMYSAMTAYEARMSVSDSLTNCPISIEIGEQEGNVFAATIERFRSF